MFRFRALLLSSLVLPLSPLAAQEVPPTPTSTATPTSSPMIIVTLPTATPTPAATPTPTPTPTPRAVETPVTRPSPRVSPSPVPAPAPTAGRSTAARPVPVATPAVIAPAPVAPAEPTAPPVIASPLPTTGEPRGEGPGWPWMLGAGLLTVAGIGVWLARRQRAPADEEIGAPVVEEIGAPVVEPAVVPVPPLAPVAPAAVAPAATLALRFRPTRVGFNMLSATVEGELTVANDGAVAASDVRVRTGLLGAHAGQDADLADFLAQPIGRPVVPAFSLASGEERTLRVVAAVAREAMRTLTAAGRPMFVPVLVADVRVDGGTQLAQGFAVGAERVDSAKLAPFWLDVPDRAYGEVAARAHGPAIVRRG